MGDNASVLFVGDSHLARVRRSLAVISAEVCNRAVGGSTVFDLSAQLGGVDGVNETHVVVSIGTNDAAPCSGVSLQEFAGQFACTLGLLNSAAVIYLAPPGVFEERVATTTLWANVTINRYRAAALEACQARDVRVIRAHDLLEPLGSKAFARDGVHLSGVGYRILLPAINTAVTNR